jgi:amino acid transporter
MMAMYPEANGSMAYVFEAFGEPVAAVAGWFLVLTYVATCAWYFVTLGWLVQAVAPWTSGVVVYSTSIGDVRAGDLVLGLTGTIAITAINLRGIAARAAFQDVMVILKIVIAAVLFTGAAMLGRGENVAPYFEGEGSAAWLGIASVAVTTPFFIAGFDVLPQAVRDRRRGMSLRSLAPIIGIATLVAFIFYSGAILSASASIDRASLRSASLPVFEAFQSGLDQPWLAFLVIVAGITGVLSGWNANLLSAARVLQGMASAGATLPYFAAERPHGAAQAEVPVEATVFISVLATLLGALGRNAIGPLIETAALPLLAVFALVCGGLIRLRLTKPDVDRPYRVPGGLVFAVLALLLSFGLIATSLVTVVLGAGDPLQWVVILMWSAVGWVFWRRASVRRSALSVVERKRRILQGA